MGSEVEFIIHFPDLISFQFDGLVVLHASCDAHASMSHTPPTNSPPSDFSNLLPSHQLRCRLVVPSEVEVAGAVDPSHDVIDIEEQESRHKRAKAMRDGTLDEDAEFSAVLHIVPYSYLQQAYI